MRLSFIALGFVIACASSENDTLVDTTFSDYKELFRPQFHFSPDSMWMNDPNGMVYYDGEYHLFYQYYPDSTVWGPMHWGHAVSADMLHWEHLPIALYPDSLGYIFSGSVVVDHKNTSGFGNNGKPPLVAIFTHHDIDGERAGTNDFQYQSIAYSNDKGRTWLKYKDNPVVPNLGIRDFRDPKVIWHEQTQRWVMVLAAYDKVQIYTSPDLKNWEYQSDFGIPGDDRLWECPDLFPMTVSGTGQEKWALIVSIQKKAPNGGTATSYFIGDFDGKTFVADNKKQKWLDYGTDNYAMITWSDIPESDGRRLAIGWMSNWDYAQVVPTQKMAERHDSSQIFESVPKRRQILDKI
ncbi:MAG: glycoside hydrolase family 32 protein [Bacteroidota bacterium]